MQPQGPEPDAVSSMHPPHPHHHSVSDRRCPWCGSDHTHFVQRGYTGPTDEVNQYFSCAACGRITYEMVAKTAREMRLGRWHAGGIYKDSIYKTRYSVSRVLKVGVNEYLIYLKPIVGAEVGVGQSES